MTYRNVKIFALLFALCAGIGACSKQDPILPGTRESIFPGSTLVVKNTTIENLPDTAIAPTARDCPYTQDSANIIWDGDKKIFSGFPTPNSVKSAQHPVCDGGFVYAGLTTGELVKVNAKSRAVPWVADIYRASNLTGGAAMTDIVAPIIIHGADIYVGGLGDAFCRLNKSTGAKKWCANIGVATPFAITDTAAFVLGINKTLYAVNINDGTVFWATKNVREQRPVTYANKIITVGKQQFDATNGNPIK